MATSNPAFSNDMFAGFEQVYGGSRSTTMTVQGDGRQNARASGRHGRHGDMVVERLL